MSDAGQHLSPYQPSWKDEFESERSRLQTVFGAAALEIAHIGSTSIEGMPSKPVIDIAVMIESQKDADGFIDGLTQIGYEVIPQAGSAERHFFTNCHPPRYHLSIAYADVGGFWHRQIVFRDYLRANQAAREEYARLKEALLRKYPSGPGASDHGEYSNGKTDLVYRTLRLAGWRVGQLYRG